MLKQTIDNYYARLMIANDGLDFGVLDELDGTGHLTKHLQNSQMPTLDIITLISQYEQMMYTHTPNSPITPLQPLPKLSTPILPSHLQRLAGQALSKAGDDVLSLIKTLEWIFGRGYVVPPTVWLPPKHLKTNFDDPDGMNFEGQLPSVYLAWQAWVNNEQAMVFDESLTADNWDEFYPAQRIKLLKNLRQSDPKTALDLIAKFAPNEPAEKRLAMIETLAVNLSEDDKVFLQSLNKDRSQKVKELAKTLLARLGEFDNEDKLADDLFDELEMTGDGISFKATKNNKKRQNNFENLQKVNLFALAKKFDLTLKDFLIAWDFGVNARRNGYYDYNRVLLERVVALLNDDEVIEISPALMKVCLKGENDYYWWLFRHRLPVNTRQEFADKQFSKSKNFYELLKIMPSHLNFGFNALKISGSFKKLNESIKQWQEKNSGYIDNYHLCDELFALGLLVNQDTAKQCLLYFEQVGIMKTDPALSVLHLNALLDKKE